MCRELRTLLGRTVGRAGVHDLQYLAQLIARDRPSLGYQRRPGNRHSERCVDVLLGCQPAQEAANDPARLC